MATRKKVLRKKKKTSTAKKGSPRRKWVEQGYQTRSQPQWRDVGYNRAADWLHEYDRDDPTVSGLRKVMYEIARIRGYVAAAKTYAKAGQGDKYFMQPDRVRFVCAVLQWTNAKGREKERLFKQLTSGKIPLPAAGKIKWKAPSDGRQPEKAGHAVARMVQMNILTRSLQDAAEAGKDIDDPWVLARVIKGSD